MATKYPTLEELKASDKDCFSPHDVAGVLGTNPYTINIMLRDCPEKLGFPAFFVGRKGTRVKIPKIPFLRKMGVKVGDEGNRNGNVIVDRNADLGLLDNERIKEGKHMNNNPIKTKDLCERCVSAECSQIAADCRHLEMIDGCPGYSVFGCKCDTIELNTPCPYFGEKSHESK